MLEIWKKLTRFSLPISVFFLIYIGVENAVQAGVLFQHVGDSETPTKSVAGAVQISVCSGVLGGEGISCKFGEGTDIVKRSVFSMAANGWRLISIVYDSDRKVAYYYFSIE